jgi:nicotinate phosphoribosyltransferase
MGARAFWIAGLDATSNVIAGRELGIPIAGTMAHAFVQAHEDEVAAFRAFADSWPETVLLVDTYDTPRGIDRVIDLARELGDDFRVRGVRLDSGDLGALARDARRRLDDAGLEDVTIFASGNLDEHAIGELLANGVGTRMTTSQDDPNLDIVYKLAQVGDRPLLKLSTDKATLPGVKQVWRRRDDEGRLAGDVIGLADEELEGEPLLVPVMRDGKRLDAGREPLGDARERARRCLAELPDGVCRLTPDRDDYPVTVSDRLDDLRARITSRLEEGG